MHEPPRCDHEPIHVIEMEKEDSEVETLGDAFQCSGGGWGGTGCNSRKGTMNCYSISLKKPLITNEIL